jgi:spore coat polysaccharide biosynthesis predicted glycosyltransferase SpsG
MQVNIKSDEYSGKRSGSVSRINKTLDPSSQNMSVFIETSDDDLYNGMYVYGNIIVGEVDNTYKIKRNLIKENNVFTIEDNKLLSTEINVIQIFEDYAIIEGLKNNDRVLNETIKGSYSGMEVKFNK